MKKNDGYPQLKREDFVFVHQNASIDQVLGQKNDGYFVSVLRRFIKNKWACLFLFFFAVILILAIYVPITSHFTPFSPVVNSQFIYNLPPEVFNHNATITVRVSNEIWKYVIEPHPDYFVPNSAREIAPYWLVTLYPYHLPQLKNLNLILGTDSYGSDIWTNLWASVAESLLIAFITSVVSMIIGVVYGAIAGINAGKVIDTIMMRIVEIISGAPTILWVMILSVVFSISSHVSGVVSKQANVVGLIFAMICIFWAQPALATRTYILKIKDSEHIQASKIFGGSKTRIIFHHILPVILGRILVIFVNLIPTIIFYEASLTFLNLKSPSAVGLGTMLNNAWQNISRLNEMLPPVIVFALFTISSQIIANALNDAIDPRIMGR